MSMYYLVINTNQDITLLRKSSMRRKIFPEHPFGARGLGGGGQFLSRPPPIFHFLLQFWWAEKWNPAKNTQVPAEVKTTPQRHDVWGTLYGILHCVFQHGVYGMREWNYDILCPKDVILCPKDVNLCPNHVIMSTFAQILSIYRGK